MNSSPGTLCIASTQIIRPKLRRQVYFDALPLRHYPFLNLFRVLKMTNTNIQASQAAADRPVRRGEVVMSSFHGSKISWSCKYGEKKKKRKNRHV